MRSMIWLVSGFLRIAIGLPVAGWAAQLASAPLSHPFGFATMHCHFVNVGTKDIVVEDFFVQPTYGAKFKWTDTVVDACQGPPPWTVHPEQGCTTDIPDCTTPYACYCQVQFSGSAKSIRGSMIGVVSGTGLSMTSELR